MSTKRKREPANPKRKSQPNDLALVGAEWTYHSIKGDLLELWHAAIEWIVIPTNGSVNKAGHAVMGAGVAKLFAEELEDLPPELGRRLRLYGNHVNVITESNINVITFPVKHKWDDPTADLKLIDRSFIELDLVIAHSRKHYGGQIEHVYLPRIGCGNGQLDWKRQVEPLVVKYARNDSYYTIVHHPKDLKNDATNNARGSKRRR